MKKGLYYPTLDQTSYSTTEIDTGMTWIDGNTIYKTTVDFGYLPNATTKTVLHNISNIDVIVKTEAFASNTSGLTYPIPFTNLSNLEGQVRMYAGREGIQMVTGIDRSGLYAYVTLYYTKQAAQS